ncbi:MAG: hypothetical protein QOF15_1263 [Mycobacterium sp.]|nr:hypothetical protein [Mycobacterium sp.]
MNDPDAIRELLACYALALDADDIDECVRLFTEDAEFEVYGKIFDGHEGIRTMFRAAPNGLHLIGASRIDVLQGTASVRSQMLFVDAGTRHSRSALYDDDLVRRQDQWLFRRRRCRFITSGGLSARPEVSQP